MKNKISTIKGFIAGALFMALLLPAITFANQASETISITFRNIRIFMDGEEFIPKDELGNTIEPFIWGGTTYLPVRALALVFGKDVCWDEEHSYIHLNTPKRTFQITTWLHEMEFESIEPADFAQNTWTRTYWPDGLQDISGHTFRGGILSGDVNGVGDRAVGDSHTITYNLDGRFTRFIGNIAVGDHSVFSEANYFIRFYSEDKMLFESEEINGLSPFHEFILDVSDVQKLTIERVVVGFDEWPNAEIGIVDAGFEE